MADKRWIPETLFDDLGFRMTYAVEKVLYELQTEHQHLVLFEHKHFGKMLMLDGATQVTTRDEFIYHEMISHPALFTHTDPRQVVIVGGGDCGTLREVLKHASVRHACQVDIDERVTRLAEQYFPELCDSNDDKRATLMFDDGIRYMADAKPGSVDIVIVDSTDPVGPAEGLFTEKFYRNCHRALRDGGIIVQQSESPLFHLKLIRAMRDAMQAAGFVDLATVNFPQCSYPSGWWSATMAGKNIKLNNFRNDAARKRPFATRYYSDGVHGAALNLPPFMITALG